MLRNPLVVLFAFILFLDLITLGTTKIIVQQTCSHVPLELVRPSVLDLFHTDRKDVVWPAHRPRKLKGRCRGGTLLYPARKTGQLPVTCGKCAVLDLEVAALYFTKVKGKRTRLCRGLVPELLQSKQDCIFQNKCNLDYRNTVIALQPKQSIDCLGRWPHRLQVRASCLNTESNPITDVIKLEQHTTSREGLIRSHFYHTRDRTTYPKGVAIYSHKTTLVLSPPEDPASNTFLLLHFHLFNLTNDSQLQVLGSSLDCQATWSQGHTYVIPSGNLPKLSLVFSVGRSRQKGDGFDICFRWFNAANFSTVMRDFEMTLSKCNQYLSYTKNKPALPIFDLIQHSASQHMTGIVRSHPKFPWNYDRPTKGTECCRVTGNHQVLGKICRRSCQTSSHTLRAPLGQTTVRLTARRLALGRGDTLEVYGRNCSVYRVSQGKTYDFESDFVTLNFTMRVSSLHTSHGFLLCYKWYSPHSINPVEADICKSFALKTECSKKSRKKKRPRSKLILPRECWS